MAGSQDLRVVSREAGEDLSSEQYRFVYADTDGQLLHCDSADDMILGILQDDPDAAGKGCLLGISGISRLEVDGNAGAIAAGSKLTSNATGQGIATTTDKEVYGAIALEASTAADDVIMVLLTPGQQVSNT